MGIKDYIITALKDENKMLQKMSSHLMDWTNTIEEIILKFKVFLLLLAMKFGG